MQAHHIWTSHVNAITKKDCYINFETGKVRDEGQSYPEPALLRTFRLPWHAVAGLF